MEVDSWEIRLLNQQRILAAEDREFRCTIWQWEQSVGVQFWNKYFSMLDKGIILRGEDYRNHIKAQPTEVQPCSDYTFLLSFCILWLVSLIKNLVSRRVLSGLHPAVVAITGIYWLCFTMMKTWKPCAIRLSFCSETILVAVSQLNLVLIYVVIYVVETKEKPSDKDSTFPLGDPYILTTLPIFIITMVHKYVTAQPCLRNRYNTTKVANQDDELILLSGYCNVALPQVAHRFKVFRTKLIHALSSFAPNTKKGLNFKQLLFRLLPSMRSESQVVENVQLWDMLSNHCCHKWSSRLTLWANVCCSICEAKLVIGEQVCYPVTSEKHPYFFHKACFRLSDLKQISEFIDPLDALLKMVTHPWVIPPSSEMALPGRLDPMHMINWQILEQEMRRKAELIAEQIRMAPFMGGE